MKKLDERHYLIVQFMWLKFFVGDCLYIGFCECVLKLAFAQRFFADRVFADLGFNLQSI